MEGEFLHMEGLKKFLKVIGDALFPRSCVLCKEEGEVLCKTCAEKVKIPVWFVHQEIGGIRIFSRVSYKERSVQKLLHAWKYQGDTSAGEWWKAWIQEKEAPSFFAHAIFVPVPLARETCAERGFNQAEELAMALATAYAGKVVNLLERRPRKSQAKKEKNERNEIRAANPYFPSEACKKLKEEGKIPVTVVLIDDVSTTGNTVLACADVLRKEGVKEITACTLAFGNDA